MPRLQLFRVSLPTCQVVQEFYYFLQGTGEMTIEEEIIPVSINDAVMVPPGVDHGIRNTGQGPLKMMIVWGISEGIYEY